MRKQQSLSVVEISRLVNGELVGDGNLMIHGANRLDEAQPGEMAFIASAKYLRSAALSHASALIVYPEFTDPAKTFIRVQDPYTAFLKVVAYLNPKREALASGIHATAIIGADTNLGKDVAIGPYVVIGRACTIGARVQIYPGTVIADGVEIGDDTVIYANVTIREDVQVGRRVILHPGVVLGADGFGFRQVNGAIEKIPQLGYVILEDDVEIGANTTIDRAVVGATRIGKGSKLDNLIQVGHNVVIGQQTLIAAQTGISGSCKIGNGVLMGGQVGLADHVTIGDRAILGAQAGITKEVAPGVMVSGYPAREHFRAKREEAVIRKLPEIWKMIQALQKQMTEFASSLTAASGKATPPSEGESAC